MSRQAPYSTQHPHQWTAKTAQAVSETSHAQTLSATTRSVSHGDTLTTREKASMAVENTTNQFGKVMDVTSSLLSRLEATLAEVVDAISQLQLRREQVLQNVAAKKQFLQNNVVARIEIRTHKPPTEIIEDEVARCLNQESGVLSQSLALLNPSTVQAIDAELGKLTRFSSLLEADIQDKRASLSIDQDALQEPLSPSMHTMRYRPSPVNPTIPPHQRAKATEQTMTDSMTSVQTAKRIVEKSIKLEEERAQAEDSAHSRTEFAIKKNLAAIEAAIRALNESYDKVNQEIQALLQTQSNLQASIRDKDEALNVAHSRLQTRRQRPERERIADSAERALLNEIRELESAIMVLKSDLVKVTTQQLPAQQKLFADLERKLALKEEALRVDADCAGVQ